MNAVFQTRVRNVLSMALCLALAASCMVAGAQSPAGPQDSAKPKKPVVATPARSAADSSNGSDEFDRSLAVVNGDLILDSDVDKEIRLQELTFDPHADRPEAEVTLAVNREQIIERLIDRELILQQVKLQDEPPVADEEVDHQITLLRQTLPGCSQHQCDSDAGWSRYLQTKDFTTQSFREQWRQRIQVLTFIEERFRSGVRVDDKTISTYYETKMLPRYKAAKAQAPPLEKVRDRIEAVLVEQEVSKLLNDWLQTLRAQGGVVIFHPGQPAP